MAQKHYHNDYKRLLGIDESRTASQKLLDKNFSSRLNVGVPDLSKQNLHQLPRKIVKKQQDRNKEVTQLQSFEKISKALLSQNNFKIIKGLKILQKFLENNQFIATNNTQVGVNKVLQLINTVSDNIKGNMVEQFQTAQQIQKNLAIITHFYSIQSQKIIYQKIELGTQKIQQTKQYKQQQQKKDINQDLHADSQSQFTKQLQLKILLLKLFTDDSFYFQKTLAKLSKAINEYLSMPISSQVSPIINYIDNHILLQMFLIPQLGLLEWAKSSIILFFKDIIKEHRDKLILMKNYSKIFQQFNMLMQKQKKKSINSVSRETNTFNIQSNKNNGNGGTYQVVQKIDSQANWYNKQ